MKRFVLCFLAACAPSLPDELPATSAASEAAKPAQMPAVAVALRTDPPLPGEDASAWTGLAPSGGHDMSGMDMGSMHHHMPGMDMPGMGMDGGTHAP